MSGIIGMLAGAPSAANTAGSYYQNAMGNEINAAGSPAASDFLRLQDASLRPQFQAQNTNVMDTLAAAGLAGSGAGKSIGGSVASNEAGTLAGAAAPLYQEALNQYGNINAAMPGAQNQAYQDAIQQFYQALGTAGQFFGLPTSGGNSGVDYSGGLPSSSDIMGDQGFNPYAPAGGP